MQRRSLLAASAAAPLTAIGRARGQSGKIQVVVVACDDRGQRGRDQSPGASVSARASPEAEVLPIYKGGYTDTLTAVIAAWRADQAPHLVQVFEVGTGSMLAAGRATKQVGNSPRRPGVNIDPARRISRRYVAITASRTAGWPRCRSIPRPR